MHRKLDVLKLYFRRTRGQLKDSIFKDEIKQYITIFTIDKLQIRTDRNGVVKQIPKAFNCEHIGSVEQMN